MGFLSDVFCCRRKKQTTLQSKDNAARLHMIRYNRRHRRTIPKRPKDHLAHVLKYLHYSTSGTSAFVPVEIHEPLSWLQKLAEPFEYSYLLDRAAEADDCAEEIKYIAAFSHAFALKIRERSSRAFDGLLGETYELNRYHDVGYVFVAEQISIAPKVIALHCVGAGWVCCSNFEYSMNVQTKYISFHPEASTKVFLNYHGSQYSWPLTLTYRLHNILFGEPFFDTFGMIEITEKQFNRCSCRMDYKSKFSEKQDDSPDVMGMISQNNKPMWNIRGFWDKGLEINERNFSSSNTVRSDWMMLWEFQPVSKERENVYFFNEYAIQLNETETGVAPTDSRLRPDIRDLENGKFKSGNIHKKSSLVVQAIVSVILEKLEQFHHAVQDPFFYLLHFIMRTQTFHNIFKLSKTERSSSIRSSMFASDVYPVVGGNPTESDSRPSDWPQPRSYSIIDSLHEFRHEENMIYIPAEMHEPLTMLQRLTEMFEFSLLLDAAAITSDVAQQMTYLATFSNLSYSTLYERVTKPFTPLLGETYECDRLNALGWRCISEQVEHVPPVSVLHCEASGWVCTQEFTYDVEINSTYVSIFPKGYVKIRFFQNNCEYRWKRNNIKIYNHVMGKLIPEVQGTTKIVGSNKAKGYKCELQYILRSELQDEYTPDMEGSVSYKSRPLVLIRGSWRDGVSASPIRPYKDAVVDLVHMAADFQQIFKKTPIPSGRELFYNMSKFACTLNRMENDIAPTDSRFREDVRSLGNGIFVDSNTLKRSLEEKQFKRLTNNWNKPPTEQYKPAWFTQNENGEWIYNGEYWQCKEIRDWSRCPQIF